MITEKAIRDAFGAVQRLPANVRKAKIETSKSHYYYFRSVRGEPWDLLVTSDDLDDDAFAATFLTQVADSIDSRLTLPCKIPIDRENPYGFEAALLVGNEYHGLLCGMMDQAREKLIYCVPIHDCEFSGEESPSVFRTMQVRTGIDKWGRAPFPLVGMSFQNPKGKHGTIGGRFVVTYVDYAHCEIRNISGVRGGHVKLLNFRNEELVITSPRKGHLEICRGRTSVQHEIDMTLKVVDRFLTHSWNAALRLSRSLSGGKVM